VLPKIWNRFSLSRENLFYTEKDVGLKGAENDSVVHRPWHYSLSTAVIRKKRFIGKSGLQTAFSRAFLKTNRVLGKALQ
jgi:hypothetical protein